EKIGLGALAEKYCGAILAHTGQKSDWSRRPLSLGQLRYATDDTKYLEAIADAQGERLKECGRLEWHRECCERAVEAAGASPKDEGKEAWRIKGSSKMSPRALALLREIWAWRDEIARQRDRPPFMIMKNEDLLGWVAWREKNPEGPVCQGPRMPQRIKEGDLVRLEDAVRRAEALSPVEWPGPLPKVRSFGAGPSQEKVEALFNACKAIAADLKMDPYFLASRATVTALVRTRPRSIAEAQEKAGMMRWQAALVMPALTKTL
ncbi:MAG: HRDC domain-containing protein, partial [Candidatus Omnitrophica bacterium]|nr:HRDC domain-containing protein [Candidatus Omnitrophota bacterium]